MITHRKVSGYSVRVARCDKCFSKMTLNQYNCLKGICINCSTQTKIGAYE